MDCDSEGREAKERGICAIGITELMIGYYSLLS